MRININVPLPPQSRIGVRGSLPFFHFFHFFIFFQFFMFFIFFFVFFLFFLFSFIFPPLAPPRAPPKTSLREKKKKEERRKKKERADRNRSPSTFARTGHFCYSRAWKPLTPVIVESSHRNTQQNEIEPFRSNTLIT